MMSRNSGLAPPARFKARQFPSRTAADAGNCKLTFNSGSRLDSSSSSRVSRCSAGRPEESFTSVWAAAGAFDASTAEMYFRQA